MPKRTWKLFDPVRRFFLRAVAGDDFSDKPIVDKRTREIIESRISNTYRMLVPAVYSRDKDAALIAAVKLVEAVETANEFVSDWKRRNAPKSQEAEGTARTKRAAGRH